MRSARILASLLLGLARRSLRFERGDPLLGRFAGDALRDARRLLMLEPEIADPMDLGDLLLGQEPAQNQTAVDERGLTPGMPRRGVRPADRDNCGPGTYRLRL